MTVLLDTVRGEIAAIEEQLGKLRQVEELALELAGEEPPAERAEKPPEPERPEPAQRRAARPARRKAGGSPSQNGRSLPSVEQLGPRVLAILQSERLTVRGIADELGFKQAPSGGHSKSVCRRVEEVLAELEGEGAIEQAGKQGRGVLFTAQAEEPSRPKPAPASTTDDAGAEQLDQDQDLGGEPEADDPVIVLPEAPSRPRAGDAGAKRIERNRRQADEQTTQVQRDVLELLERRGPRTLEEIHDELSLADRGLSRHRFSAMMRRFARVEAWGDRDGKSTWRRIPLPGERESVTITHLGGAGDPGVLEQLDADRLRILEELARRNLTVLELARILERPPAVVGGIVSDLQRAGEIRKQPGGTYERMRAAA